MGGGPGEMVGWRLLPSGSSSAANPRAPVLVRRLDFERHPSGFEFGVRSVHVRDEEADVIYAGRILEQAKLAPPADLLAASETGRSAAASG